MRCFDVQERLSAAIDGETFPEEVAAETAAHLEECGACAQAARELSSVHRLLLEDLARGLLAPAAARRTPWGRRIALGAAGIMAAAVLWAIVWPLRRPVESLAPVREVAELPEEPQTDPPPSPPPTSSKPVPIAEDEPGHAMATIGSLARFEGETIVFSGERETPARPGQELMAGQGVRTTGQESWAQVECSDGTQLALGPETRVARFSEGAGAAFFLERGMVEVHAVRPLVIATPQAAVAILGTRLTVATEREATLVRVVEGRVKLTRLNDGASVEVPPGHFATTMGQGSLKPWKVGEMPPDGLVLWLRLDEGRGGVAADASGRGNHGVLKGTGMSWAAGRNGGALDFAGDDSHVKISGAASLCPVSQQVAVGAWIKVRAGNARGSDIVSSGSRYGLRILENGNAMFRFGGESVTTTDVNVDDGAWHHVLGQKSAEALEIYVNGLLRERREDLKASPQEASPPDVLLGGAFNGWIDEVHLHVRTLAPDEIRAIALLGR